MYLLNLVEGTTKRLARLVYIFPVALCTLAKSQFVFCSIGEELVSTSVKLIPSLFKLCSSLIVIPGHGSFKSWIKCLVILDQGGLYEWPRRKIDMCWLRKLTVFQEGKDDYPRFALDRGWILQGEIG